MSRPWDLETLRSALVEPLNEALPDQTALRLDYLCPPKAVADDATKLVATDTQGKPHAVVLVASPSGPDLVRRGLENASEIKQRLGDDLGTVVLEPLCMGTIEQRTFAVFPYCKPMSTSKLGKRAHRIMLRPIVLNWLSETTRQTARVPSADQRQNAFNEPLMNLSGFEPLKAHIRNAASEAVERINTQRWEPRHIVMHGDLWEGNILFAHDRAKRQDPFARIVIIDWPSGLADGYAMYDIIRLSRSMHLPRRVLRREILKHCEHLGCEPRDARAHLLAAFGHLSMNLGHFPPDRFARLAEQCDALLTNTIA